MIKLSVCIGTACHLKGSRDIIEKLQQLIMDNRLKDSVDMSGKFCLGRCNSNGVSVSVDGQEFSIKPEDTEAFFNAEILGRLNK